MLKFSQGILQRFLIFVIDKSAAIAISPKNVALLLLLLSNFTHTAYWPKVNSQLNCTVTVNITLTKQALFF